VVKKKLKILIGCPTYDGKAYCLEYWAKKLKELEKVGTCNFLIVDNSKGKDYAKAIKKQGLKVLKSKHYDRPIKSIGESREKLYEYALKNNYDFLFSVEQDIFLDKKILKELLKSANKINKKEFVLGAPYYYCSINKRGKPPYGIIGYISCVAKSLIYSKEYRRKIQNIMLDKELEKKKGLIKAFAVGFGCCLIPTTVLRKIKVKYSENNFKPDDAFFYQDCERLGIPVYADVDLRKYVKHIPGSVSPKSNGLFSWAIKKKR